MEGLNPLNSLWTTLWLSLTSTETEWEKPTQTTSCRLWSGVLFRTDEVFLCAELPDTILQLHWALYEQGLHLGDLATRLTKYDARPWRFQRRRSGKKKRQNIHPKRYKCWLQELNSFYIKRYCRSNEVTSCSVFHNLTLFQDRCR